MTTFAGHGGARPDAPTIAGPWRSEAGSPLSGVTTAPGDKSISHRALIFGALAEGETTIHGLLEADDVLRTAGAMRMFGASVERDLRFRGGVSHGGDSEGGVWRVVGAPWADPDRPVYFGNSGTGCRLTIGAAAGQGVGAEFDGDASLRRRPMGRIMAPLGAMGARTEARDGRLPLRVVRGGMLEGIDFTLPVASAQIKSAVILAALGAGGATVIREPIVSRDHTERMLKAFGADIAVAPGDAGGRTLRVPGRQRLKATAVAVPGDPSSAAFIVAAASLIPDSDVTVRNVLVNPLRSGFYATLAEMGARIEFLHERLENGEPVADIRARFATLKGVCVPSSRAPSMIDEYPILAVVAAFAEGDTYMPGIEELRVKESDRIDATQAMLTVNGVESDAGPDWLRVCGRGRPEGGGTVATHGDHRIAMGALVFGLASRRPIAIDDASMIATSFPAFPGLMASLGARMGPVN